MLHFEVNMKRFFPATFFLLIYVVGLLYVLPQNRPFPGPPPDAVQSLELADVETPLRRAYFTNYTRDQVMAHYAAQMTQWPHLTLNYPPEDAQTIIRDQTRSWYLEELVQPLRQSVFVNGFIAQKPQDDIWYKGVHYQQKITIRLAQSSRLSRFVIWSLITALMYIVFICFLRAIKSYAPKRN